ncbi:MAG TPA: protoporphyrinogen oxidase, partial [Pirellulales bacterium]|nr:protoporphyrinogen oxidase [Pirellulales bacterium]
MNAIVSPRRIAIIGGGIAGLAAANRLRELDPSCDLTLFEASSRLGGSLWTERRDEFLIEHGADSFITNVPWGVDLCRRLGLADDLVGTSENGRQAFVVRRGRLCPIPDGFMLMAPSKFWPIVKTPILSPIGKLRLAWEYFVPRRREENGHDESLASFVCRRLGREAFDRLVQPLVAGIYTADPEKLSLAATLPRFQVMEREYGSLIRATLQQRHSKPAGTSSNGPASGARYGMFVTPRAGLSSVVNVIAARLGPGAIQTNAIVRAITRIENRWLLNNGNLAAETRPTKPKLGNTNGHDGEASPSPSAKLKPIEFDALVVATPAPVASQLLANAEPTLAADLAGIEYAGAVVVSMAFDRKQILHSLDGFGFVVPAIERRQILSASFSSVKFPGRAPADKILIRTFVGGACQRELCNLDDSELERLVTEELTDLIGLTGQPLWTTIARWSNSMPQYHVGHLDRIDRIEARVACAPGLALAGSAYRG